MSAGQMTAFSALVSVCSGLGSIVTLLVLLAILLVKTAALLRGRKAKGTLKG